MGAPLTWVSESLLRLNILLTRHSGNVSYEVPGFHGGFYIPADGVNHTPQFTAGAGSEEGFRRALYCAAGMAVVGCQVLTDDDFASKIKLEFEKDA